jgi:hypothetical protein
MKKGYLLTAMIVAVLGTVAWVRLSSDPDDMLSGNEPARPSPVDEQLPRPAPIIEREMVRTRVAEASTRKDEANPSTNLDGNDWAVVAAIYKEYDAAARRARNVMDSTSIDPTVFPAKGQGSKYMVVLGSGLTHVKATELRNRAIAAGLPSDTYVTRLTGAQ